MNFETHDVIELKPNNAPATTPGEKQAERYAEELAEATGDEWTWQVLTYD